MKRLHEGDDDDDDDYEDIDFDAIEPEEDDGSTVKTGTVDTSGCMRGLYLMKFPTRFMRSLERGAKGRLRLPTVADETTGRAVGELILENGEANEPNKYEVHIKPEPSKIIVFSSKAADDEGKALVEGTVSHQCVTRPVIDAKFRNMIRLQAKAAQPKRRTITLNDEELRKAEHRVVKVETAQQKEERKFLNQQKRHHSDLPDAQWRKETTTRLFELFNTRPHWSLVELSSIMDEPQQKLKTILGEACVYNKGGPHRNMYELKDEYKTKEQREQKAEELQTRKEARKAEAERTAQAREEREAYEAKRR